MEIPAPLFEPGLEIWLRHSSNGGFCDEAFEEFCRANPDLRIERNAQGEIIVIPPAGGESSHRNATLTWRLMRWAARDGRGQAFDSSAAFHLPDGSLQNSAKNFLFPVPVPRVQLKVKGFGCSRLLAEWAA